MSSSPAMNWPASSQIQIYDGWYLPAHLQFRISIHTSCHITPPLEPWSTVEGLAKNKNLVPFEIIQLRPFIRKITTGSECSGACRCISSRTLPCGYCTNARQSQNAQMHRPLTRNLREKMSENAIASNIEWIPTKVSTLRCTRQELRMRLGFQVHPVQLQ